MEQNNSIFNEKELNELSELIKLIDPDSNVFSKSKEEIEKLSSKQKKTKMKKAH